MTEILDGNKIAEKIKKETRWKILSAKMKRRPRLVIFLIGDDFSSEIYVKNKEKFCEEVGVETEKFLFSRNTDEKKILKKISKVNKDRKVDAILVQLPLPKHLDTTKIIESVNPEKDVDVLHSKNFGFFCEYGKCESKIPPVTAGAILRILEEYRIPVESREVTIIGNSNIVGKPTALALSQMGATVTICHDKTRDLASHTKKADVLISAAGQKELVSGEMVKKGVVVIDVGICRKDEHQRKICGDIDFPEVKKKASHITPVPGGVGPVTVAILVENVVKLATKKEN